MNTEVMPNTETAHQL